jgi:segregation and condensation protein A
MAATLVEIKSAMLLPQADAEQVAQEEAGDPRAELIRQLLEYKKFKDAANLLDAAADRHQERFGRPVSLIDRLAPETEPEIDMDQVSIWDLLEAFDAVCKATGGYTYTGHIQDDTPIDLYQIEILHRLQTEGPLTFERIFDSRPNRLMMVGLFLGVLELIRNKLLWAEQGENTHQIYLRTLTDEAPESAVRRAIMATDQAEAEAAPPAETSETPPIPIVEVPPASKPEAGEPQEVDEEPDELEQVEDTEQDPASADDDFLFDKP